MIVLLGYYIYMHNYRGTELTEGVGYTTGDQLRSTMYDVRETRDGLTWAMYGCRHTDQWTLMYMDGVIVKLRLRDVKGFALQGWG